MRTTIRLILFIFTLLVLTASNYAQTQAEQLKQMVTQLQTTPGDNALRERIIKLAPTVKPAPVISDEAIRFEGRAQFAFANAKSDGDFLVAAQEYEKAVIAAPWVQGYYSDLCKIYEKAGKFEDAKRHCGFFLIGLTDPTQITEVKRRIAGLEFGIEKTVTANAEATRLAAVKKAEDDRIARTEAEKRQAEQAQRDVITKIKNAVNNRSFMAVRLSCCQGQRNAGISENERLGEWFYWEDGGPFTWKFFDDHVELWGEESSFTKAPSVLGESWGPNMTDMRWYDNTANRSNREREESKYFKLSRTWGHFDLSRGYLYINPYGQRPINDSEYSNNNRYLITLYKP